MIVTLTPNPSLDRTVEIPHLQRGEVHRATGGRVDGLPRPDVDVVGAQRLDEVHEVGGETAPGGRSGMRRALRGAHR